MSQIDFLIFLPHLFWFIFLFFLFYFFIFSIFLPMIFESLKLRYLYFFYLFKTVFYLNRFNIILFDYFFSNLLKKFSNISSSLKIKF